MESNSRTEHGEHMIFSEGVLIAAWMIFLGQLFLFIKILTRGTWVASSLGIITPGG